MAHLDILKPEPLSTLLGRIGVIAEKVELIGSGGQLLTHRVTARVSGSVQTRDLVIKRINPNPDIDLAFRYGSSPTGMLAAEREITGMLYDEGLGPPPVDLCESVAIRDFWSGRPLHELYANADVDEAAALFLRSLTYLREVLDAIRRHEGLGYVDFNCSNVLQGDDGRLFLIDHEWAVLKFRSFDELERSTLFKYLRSVLECTPDNFSADLTMDVLRRSDMFTRAVDQVGDLLAVSYYSSHKNRLAIKIENSTSLRDRLAATAFDGAPREILDRLCQQLNMRGVRWSFRRPYDAVWSTEDYEEKDIDVYVAPEDFHSFIDAAWTTGFAIYNHTNFLRYCGRNKRAIFLQAHLHGPAKSGDMRIDALLERRTADGSRWHLDLIDQAAVYLIQAVRVKGLLSDGYRARIAAVLSRADGGEALGRRLQSVWGTAAGHDISVHLQKSDLDSAFALGRAADARNNVLSSRWLRLRQTASASGPRIVAFLGVDGAGKSTTLSHVQEALTHARFVVNRYYLGCYYPPSGRGQSFVLPTDAIMTAAFRLLRFLRALKLAPVKLTRLQPSPQKAGDAFIHVAALDERRWTPPLARGGECDNIVFRLYAYILVLDCLLKGIVLRWRARGSFVFSDRYFYDLATFLGPDHRLTRVIAWAFPPDCALFLHAASVVQAARAPRHPLSEIRANQDIYRAMPVLNPGIEWREISTELPPSVVAQRALFLCMTTARKPSKLKAASMLLSRILARVRK